jgi:high-affinity Fe2+/Pb2+ permease
MQTFLRTIEFLTLSLWLGADAFLSFVVAPGAFATLGNRDAAGTMVGFALGRLHIIGIVLGVVFLLARLVRGQAFGGAAAWVTGFVALMLVLTAVSQFTVSRRMATLRAEMGSVQSTPENDPRRVKFNTLHQRSVAFEGAVLLLGLSTICLLVRETAARP